MLVQLRRHSCDIAEHIKAKNVTQVSKRKMKGCSSEEMYPRCLYVNN